MSQNDLTNCPIHADNVNNANDIFGPYHPSLRGWTTRKTPKRVSNAMIHIPREYYKLNTFITIGADVMFVVGVPFFVIHSRKNKFTTFECLP